MVIIICCCLSVGYGLYLKYFVGAYNTFNRISRVSQAQKGMTRQQVLQTLSTPDSTYWEKSKADSLLVMAYQLPDTDGSMILVKLLNDSVRSVKYQQ
ncbi:hypothetical protein [Hymenobacter rubidus]|uniref:hypothetical protein n=1 Tax=Hymenobacter rubidus TaxID=1441626 RepID=UPI00191D344D|nr:hypothetical protein [Hymenobacter rubidus]